MEKNLRYDSADGTPILDSLKKTDRLYQVPTAYFDELPDAIMAKIRLNNLTKDAGFTVPEGYFEGLAGQIMSKIHAENLAVPLVTTTASQSVEEELEEVAPFLLQISKKQVYSVPNGYFESLNPLRLADKAEQPVDSEDRAEGGKVISMNSRNGLWRTAVAAAAVVLVLISGQRFFSSQQSGNNNGVPEHSGPQFAAKIYTENDSFDKGATIGLEELSDDEILGYLSTPDPSTPSDSLEEAATEETQKAISDMTNEELESYLEKTPATY